MNLRLPVLVFVATFALLAIAGPASAEIVFLNSGRTLSVKSHKLDGEFVILTLRSGSEVTCDKSLIQKIEADEVAYIEPETPKTEKTEEIAAAAPVQQDRLLPEDSPFAEIIASAAEANGVDPMLVSALIKVESGYRPSARSRKGAMGLMQLMPSTAREYNVRHPFEPKANIEAGIKHLKTLLDRFDGGVVLALAAYNAGPGAVEKFNGIPPYRETRDYVARILSLAGLQ